MRRVGDIYKDIATMENLLKADAKARRKKTSTYGVRAHDANKEENLKSLLDTFEKRSFVNSEYETFDIFEPKRRKIYRLPYFPDRICHHALMNVLEPIWTKLFTKDTYSCIKGRGIHGAARAVRAAMKDKEGTKYCLKIDIRQFYPSIDHDILKRIIRRKIKCKDTLKVLDTVIDSADGVPIGNYLSQYFANIYLSYFDHWVKEVEKVRYYFRYADDMVFLSDDKRRLRRLLVSVKEYLGGLKLELKGNEQIFPIADSKYDKQGRGIDFVGYVFYHDHTAMRKGIKKNFCRKAAKLNKRPNIPYDKYKQALCGWTGWAKHADCKNLLNKIIIRHEDGKRQGA